MISTKTIEQTVTFKARPHDVYEALMDTKKHSQFTEAPASLSRKIGGEFTAYGGALTGTILELVPDIRIVLSWRSDDESWPSDYYSTATFSLEEIDGGTRLTLVQTGVPEQSFSEIDQGWQTYYWSKLEQFLES